MTQHRRNSDIAELHDLIIKKQYYIEELKSGLQYADHGAYSQDKKRIFELQREISDIYNELSQLESHRA